MDFLPKNTEKTIESRKRIDARAVVKDWLIFLEIYGQPIRIKKKVEAI